jgi:hypothetical protein
MKVLLFAIALILCVSGLSSAQAAGAQKTADQRQARAARSALPRPSPAELRRCAMSHKILNSTARSACVGRPRRTG